MAGDTILTVVGNLVADPELRHTASGVPVVGFRLATNPRSYDRETATWKDEPGIFLSAIAWRDLAEHIAQTFRRGMRVIVTGRLTMRTYESDGEMRNVIEIQVDEAGPSLRFATAKIERTGRSSAAMLDPAEWGDANPAAAA